MTPPSVSEEMIRALDEAIEGECDGLALSNEQLTAILEHVAPTFAHLPAGSEAVKPVAWLATRPNDGNFPKVFDTKAQAERGLEVYFDVYDIALFPVYAAPPSTPPAANVQEGLNPDALAALKDGQRQLDMDGCEVGVSRQALDELIAAYEALRSKQAPTVAVQAALEWAVEALQHSEPKASHYPEPVERHKQALDHCKNAIEHLSGRSKQVIDEGE